MSFAQSLILAVVASLLGGADDDAEARAAIWTAVCLAADDVRSRFRVRSIRAVGGGAVRPGIPTPPVKTWRLVEALSLLCLLLRANDASGGDVDILGKTGPIEIVEDGIVRYVWAQQSAAGDHSALRARPDLLVASTGAAPGPENAVRIIDTKCVRDLGAQTVRSEFGKAHDLRVATYFIWTFYTPSAAVVAGAKGLGLDVEALGFDTDRRTDLVRDPAALISRVAYSQEQARRAHRFARVLRETGDAAQRKLLGPAN